MASSNEHKEDRVGYGIIKPAQGIYEASATQKAEIGYRILVGDRVFRYAYAGGTDLAAGKLLVNAALVPEINKACGTAAAAGAYAVTNITTAAGQTTLAGGYLSVNDAAGEGITYRIKSSAANATTSTSTDVTLYDPIVTALTTSSEVTLMANPYYDLDLMATITDPIIGIAPIPVTANYYFWCQTWGPCAVLAMDTTASGSILVPGTDDGSVTIQTAFTSNIVGHSLAAGVDEEFRLVFLRITP